MLLLYIVWVCNKWPGSKVVKIFMHPKSQCRQYLLLRMGLETDGHGADSQSANMCIHDDVIKWKRFPRNWSFVRGIHQSPVNSPHKGQWRGALMFTLICVWINGCVNNRKAGDLRRYCAHYGVTVMIVVNRLQTGGSNCSWEDQWPTLTCE